MAAMKNERPIPCPVCGNKPEMEEKTYEHVYLIGDFYQCKIKCPACGHTVIRTSEKAQGMHGMRRWKRGTRRGEDAERI